MNLEELKQLAEESWEGCDGCTEQDEIMYKNGYVKGYNAAIAELPKEISDEEIEKAANAHFEGDLMWSERIAFKLAIRWYREQISLKVNKK